MFETLYSFSDTDTQYGSYPNSLVYSNNALYGSCRSGGTGDYGTIFSINNNNFTLLHTFSGINSSYPNSLVYSNNTLYGNAGGGYQPGNYGTIFSIGVDGNNFTILYSFSGTDGTNPNSLFYSNNTLYGTCVGGGTSDLGTIFSIGVDGNNFTTLHSFSGTDGNVPNSLVYSNNTLYGTCQVGGTDSGTIFSIGVDGNNFTTLYSFSTTDGSNPNSLVYNNILYGICLSGGTGSLGTVFSIGVDGNNFTTLYSFSNINTTGGYPNSLLYNNNNLYGACQSGGTGNLGTIFSIGVDGNNFTTLYSFSGTDGMNPNSLIYNNNLYGTCPQGGTGSGTVFEYSLPAPPIPPIPPIPICPICFVKNTPITTDQGIIHIEKINPDIHTINNKKIMAITKTISQDKYLICFEKHSLGFNSPNKKTIMSKNHNIVYKGKNIKANKFIGQFDVKRIKYNGEILYNVLMEKHEYMRVNNIVCETLHPNNIIAKLYKSYFSEDYKTNIINMMNKSIIKNDYSAYNNIIKFI